MATGIKYALGALAEPDQQALREIGQQLRDARLARCENLTDIAAYLRIKPNYLAALEAGDVTAMPSQPYALGFLRSYADHLALNGSMLAARLKPSVQATEADRKRPRPNRQHKSKLAPTVGMLVSLFFVAALWLAYRTVPPTQEGHRAIVDPPPLSASLGRAQQIGLSPTYQADPTYAADATGDPSPLAVLAAVDSEDAALPTARPAGRVALVGHSGSWLRIYSADGTFVRSGTLAAGERLELPLQPDLRLSTGDGGAIEVLVDGRSIGLLGQPGTVMYDVALVPEALAAGSRLSR